MSKHIETDENKTYKKSVALQPIQDHGSTFKKKPNNI